MEVRTIDINNSAYTSFVSGRNLFLQHHWRQLFDDGMVFLGVFKGESLVAIFHAYCYRRFGKSFFIASPFAPHCGLEMDVNAGGLYKRQTGKKRILRSIAGYLASEAKASYIELALPPSVIDIQPFIWAGLEINVRYTYRLALGLEDEALLAAMSPERRKNIRDASKMGYEVAINTTPQEVRALVTQTLTDGGVGFDKTIVDRLVQIEQPWLFWVTVFKNGQLKAATVIGADGTSGWYLMGGHNSEGGDTLAGVWSMWQAILETKRRGLKFFDFLGSSIPRIEQFFRGFGGELVPSYAISGGKGIFGAIKDLKNSIRR